MRLCKVTSCMASMASDELFFAQGRARWIFILKTLTAHAGQDDSNSDFTGYPVGAANVPVAPSGSALPASTSSSVIPFLGDAKGSLTGTPIDLPCTATEQRTCQIVPHLSLCNELLCHAQLQLREVSAGPGQLSLVAAQIRSFPKPTKEEQVRAVALAYWLVATHRCIASVDVSVFDGHDQLACDAFYVNSSVKTLKFDSGSVKIRQNLFRFVSLLGNVEELECTAFRSPVDDCLVGALGCLLRFTTSLRSLKLSMLTLGMEGAAQLSEGLRANCTIQELSVHASVAHCIRFREYLQRATKLTSLTVCTGLESRKWALEPILRGLLENKSITDVTFRDFVLEWECAELVFRVLAQNRVLHAFHVIISRCYPFEEPESNYTLWGAALGESCALKEVTLPMDILRPQQWKMVFKALSTNKSVKKLNLEMDDIIQRSPVPQVCRAIRESGAEGKVFLGTVFTNDIDVLSCKASTEPVICGSRFPRNSNQLLIALRSLPPFDHITSLSLQLEVFYFAGDVLSAVTDFISSTVTLQKLSVHSYGQETSDFWKAIMQSVSRNTSIWNLELTAHRFSNENAERFADVVNASRTITTLYFNALQPCETSAFLRRLSEAVQDNYTLLNINFRGVVTSDSTRNWITAVDTARRNSGLVALAARFVAGGRRDRYCAQALELMYSHPALLKEIMKLSSVTKTEASAMVRKSLSDIASMLAFMKMAGIVQFRLECHPREGGRMQLDDLNDDCLRLLRSYLKISDVRDTP